jgi:hypothetical protein
MLYGNKICETFATAKKAVRMICTRSHVFTAKKVATYVDLKVETNYSRQLFCHEKIRFARQNSQVENRFVWVLMLQLLDKRSTIKTNIFQEIKRSILRETSSRQNQWKKWLKIGNVGRPQTTKDIFGQKRMANTKYDIISTKIVSHLLNMNKLFAHLLFPKRLSSANILYKYRSREWYCMLP